MPSQAKQLARRARTLDPMLWATLLDTLCTDADLDRLTRRHLQAAQNAPLPADRTQRVAALIPAPGEHPFAADLATSLLRIAPPGPPPGTPDDAREALLTASEPRAFGTALWRALAAPDDAVAESAAAAALDMLGGPQTNGPGSDSTADIAGEIVEAVLDNLNPALDALRKGQQHADTAAVAAQSAARAVEKTVRELRETLGQFRGDLARLTTAARALEDRVTTIPQAAPPPRIDAEALAVRVAGVLAASPPPWATDLAERLLAVETTLSTLPGLAVDCNHVRAIRQAWWAAHPGAPLRIGLFADCANLYYGARAWHDKRVDFTALRARLGVGGDVTHALAFAVQLLDVDQSGFLNALRRAQWEPRLRVPKQFGDHLKANWDVGLTLAVVALAGGLDVVGLATGDGDFVDLLAWLRGCGIRTRVAAIPESAAADLRAAADEFLTIDDALLRPIPSREPSADLRLV